MAFCIVFQGCRFLLIDVTFYFIIINIIFLFILGWYPLFNVYTLNNDLLFKNSFFFLKKLGYFSLLVFSFLFVFLCPGVMCVCIQSASSLIKYDVTHAMAKYQRGLCTPLSSAAQPYSHSWFWLIYNCVVYIIMLYCFCFAK